MNYSWYVSKNPFRLRLTTSSTVSFCFKLYRGTGTGNISVLLTVIHSATSSYSITHAANLLGEPGLSGPVHIYHTLYCLLYSHDGNIISTC